MAHFIVGMTLVGLGIWGVVAWWSLFGLVMRGVVPFFLLFLGLLAILASTRRVDAQALEVPDPDFSGLDDNPADGEPAGAYRAN